MTLLRMTDRICEDLKARIGIDRAKGTYPAYYYMRRTPVSYTHLERADPVSAEDRFRRTWRHSLPLLRRIRPYTTG